MKPYELIKSDTRSNARAGGDARVCEGYYAAAVEDHWRPNCAG
jgi:hypothetical protein